MEEWAGDVPLFEENILSLRLEKGGIEYGNGSNTIKS